MDKAKLDYTKRTLRHIRRVQENAIFLIQECSDILELTDNDKEMLLGNVLHHDSTKWSKEQFEPYVNKFNRKVDDGLFESAWKNHYETENHHIDRGEIFTRVEMIEVVCDLQAMAQEFNEGTCAKYFNEKWIPEFNKWWEDNKSLDLALYIADDCWYSQMIDYMHKIIRCFD